MLYPWPVQTPEDVWAAERVLPHGTVQNLSKWSMYRDEGMLEGLGPPAMTWLGEKEGEVLWVPDREGEPTGPWFDKVHTHSCTHTHTHIYTYTHTQQNV